MTKVRTKRHIFSDGWLATPGQELALENSIAEKWLEKGWAEVIYAGSSRVTLDVHNSKIGIRPEKI